MKTYLKLKTFPLFKARYVYLDAIDEYQADYIFVREKLHVTFYKEMRKDDISYAIIVVKVSKKDTEKFEKCMRILAKKMALKGYDDYPEVCEYVFENLLGEGKK
jgi:hypothetical protein